MKFVTRILKKKISFFVRKTLSVPCVNAYIFFKVFGLNPYFYFKDSRAKVRRLSVLGARRFSSAVRFALRCGVAGGWAVARRCAWPRVRAGAAVSCFKRLSSLRWLRDMVDFAGENWLKFCLLIVLQVAFQPCVLSVLCVLPCRVPGPRLLLRVENAPAAADFG